MRQEILNLLFISAQLYPLMQSLGLSSEQAVVICAENQKDQNILINELKKLGAKQTEIRIFKKEVYRNFLLYFAQIQKSNREQDVLDFLDEDTSLKVLTLVAFLPDYLVERFDEEWIFWGENDMSLSGTPQMCEQMNDFVQYIRKNPFLVYRELRLFAEENKNLNCDMGGKLWLMLKAAVSAWCIFYREIHTENETLYERQRLCEIVDSFSELPARFSLFDEMGDAVGKLLLNYVNEQSDIIVGDVDRVDSKLAEAIQKKRGILEKDGYYYVPEELLRLACKSIENAVSFLGVKRSLYDEGYLICNNVRGGNYTTKLLVTNVYGYTCRPRFIKLRKELVESATSIGFRKENNLCI